MVYALSLNWLFAVALLLPAALVVLKLFKRTRSYLTGCVSGMVGLSARREWWETPRVEASAEEQTSQPAPKPPAGPCPACGAPEPKQHCSRCKQVSYCGKECQLKHWRAGHKAVCKPASQPSTALAAPKSAAKPAPGSDEDELAPIPSKILYPYDKYLKLHKQQQASERPVGLVNCGNTCFANAVLQCLLHTQPLAAFLRSGAHLETCSKPRASDWCLMCEMTVLMQQVTEAQDKGAGSVNPRTITRGVRHIAPHFFPGRQEDSHDLYLAMLEQMEAVLLHQANATKQTETDSRARETTFMGHCFTGYVCYQTVCTSCGWVSQRFDTKVALEVDVSARTPTLETSLAAGFSDEQLDEDNKYKCDRCKQAVCATRHSCVEVAPNILVLCLKRFGLGRHAKNNRRVEYRETLDMDMFKSEESMDQRPARYRLYGVLVHVDVMNSTAFGHYVAFVRVPDGRWFLCDDDRITQVEERSAMSQNAYMLFYQREEPHAPPDTSRWPARQPPGKHTPPAQRRCRIWQQLQQQQAAHTDAAVTNGHMHTNGYHATTNGYHATGENGHGAAANGHCNGHNGAGTSRSSDDGCDVSENGGGSHRASLGQREENGYGNGHVGGGSVSGHEGGMSGDVASQLSQLQISRPAQQGSGVVPATANGHVTAVQQPSAGGLVLEDKRYPYVHRLSPQTGGSEHTAQHAGGTQDGSASGQAAAQSTQQQGGGHAPAEGVVEFASVQLPADQAALPVPNWRVTNKSSTNGAVAETGGDSDAVAAAPLTLYVSLPGVTSAADVRFAVYGNQLLVWVADKYLLPLVLPALPQEVQGGDVAGAADAAGPDVRPAAAGWRRVSYAPAGAHSFRARSSQLKVSLCVSDVCELFEAGEWGVGSSASSVASEASVRARM